MRKSEICRETTETKIRIELNLDERNEVSINSGSGFFNHMLTLFAMHGNFGLRVECNGDVDVDFHHSAEDIGIALGKCFKDALGDKRGIQRYGDIILPMDEALILCALDFSGRSFLNYDVNLPATKLFDNADEKPCLIGSFDAELVEEFFMAFVRTAEMTLHLKQLEGKNSHHIVECVFKAFGRAIKKAVAIDESTKNEIPSTKGMI